MLRVKWMCNWNWPQHGMCSSREIKPRNLPIAGPYSNKHFDCFLEHNINDLGARVARSVECLNMNWTTGWSGSDPRQSRREFSSSLCVQTGSGVCPASYPMGTRGPFPGAKVRPGHNANHSPPSTAKAKNEDELYLFSPQAPPWRVVGQL
jgi:hypothetical protein